MEEAKDIRELKSLLSGLSPDDGAQQVPVSRVEEKATDASAKKIALLKSLSVLLFSLSLFLSLLLLFFLVRVYLIGPSYNNKQQTIARPPVPEEAPAATAPAPVVTEPPALALPAAHEVVHNEPVPAEKEEPPAVELKEAGGSLYFIALKHYGKADETIYDLILQANPAITDVRQIDDQQKIVVPSITAESYVKGSVQEGYRIHVGTYETAQWADIYGARVKSAEKRIIVEPQQYSSRDTWYRLMLGDFTHKEEALQAVDTLVKKGLIFLPPPPG